MRTRGPLVEPTALLALLATLLVACGSRVEPLPQSVRGETGEAPLPIAPRANEVSRRPTSEPGTPDRLRLGRRSASASQNATPTQTCKGGATDVGVSADRVRIGLIASRKGPLPRQFDAAVEAVDAYVRMINASGGICGRSFELLVRDDFGNGATNLQVATELVEEKSIFAFVGSVSAPDDSGIAKVSRKHKVPDIGFPLTWERTENPYTFGVPGQIQRHLIGHGASGSRYLNEANGIKQVAMFWLKESEVSILSAWAFETAMMLTSGGSIRICYEQPTSVFDNNFTTYVVKMAGRCDPSRGPVAVYSTMENNSNIKLAIAMRDQRFAPKVFAPTFSSYHRAFIDEADGATEGAYIAMPQVPFERLDRPRSEWSPGTYELKRYVDALERFHPRHEPPGSFGAPGWGMAGLFFAAVEACGAVLSRACLLRTLNRMPAYTANGFLSPMVPRLHRIYQADLIVQVRNGRFVEIRPHDRSGPPGAQDFWDRFRIFNWQRWFCAHQSLFPNAEAKKKLVHEC